MSSRRFSSSTLRPTSPRSQTSSCTRSGNVVVAHEQHVERHVLAEAHELIAAARELQAAALEQLERRVGEPPGFLHGELEALVFVDGFHSVNAVSDGAGASGGSSARDQAWRCRRLTASE